MNKLIPICILLVLNACSISYAPQPSANEDSKDLCRGACNLGKNSCTTECSKTHASKKCIAACELGFKSCSTECEKTKADLASELKKLKSNLVGH